MGGPTVTLQNAGTVGFFKPLIPLWSFRSFISILIGLNII